MKTDEQNAQRVLSYVTRAVLAIHLAGRERVARAPALEAALAPGLERAPTQSQKAAWFNAYRDTVLSRDGVAWLERVWRREEQVPGLTLAEPDEIAMALELAVREVPGWDEILRRAARSHAESRPQGAIRVRDAGALRRSGGARAGVCAVPLRREPAARAVGARVAAVSESPAARGARAAVRAPGARPAAGDSADRRHLLSDALDGFDALGAPLAGGGGDRAEFPGRATRSIRSGCVDDPHAADELFRVAATVRLKPDLPDDTGCRLQPDHQLWTHSFGFPVPSSVPLMYQFLPSGS